MANDPYKQQLEEYHSRYIGQDYYNRHYSSLGAPAQCSKTEAEITKDQKLLNIRRRNKK